MPTDVFGLVGIVLIGVFVVPSLWASWRDFRKRYAGMCERADEYACLRAGMAAPRVSFTAPLPPRTSGTGSV